MYIEFRILADVAIYRNAFMTDKGNRREI